MIFNHLHSIPIKVVLIKYFIARFTVDVYPVVRYFPYVVGIGSAPGGSVLGSGVMDFLFNCLFISPSVFFKRFGRPASLNSILHLSTFPVFGDASAFLRRCRFNLRLRLTTGDIFFLLIGSISSLHHASYLLPCHVVRRTCDLDFARF